MAILCLNCVAFGLDDPGGTNASADRVDFMALPLLLLLDGEKKLCDLPRARRSAIAVLGVRSPAICPESGPVPPFELALVVLDILSDPAAMYDRGRVGPAAPLFC